ncbi:MAG: hypothetical protein JNM56_27300 [Planctomycetia bacterium]|nr:hypothetical protein [Planctomycetia bacterium]
MAKLYFGPPRGPAVSYRPGRTAGVCGSVRVVLVQGVSPDLSLQEPAEQDFHPMGDATQLMQKRSA